MVGIVISETRPTEREVFWYNLVGRHISDLRWWISPARRRAGLPAFRSGPITPDFLAWARACFRDANVIPAADQSPGT